jgi:hypothetical protein
MKRDPFAALRPTMIVPSFCLLPNARSPYRANWMAKSIRLECVSLRPCPMVWFEKGLDRECEALDGLALFKGDDFRHSDVRAAA